MLEAVWSKTVRAACPAHAVLLVGTTRVALGYRDPEGEHQLVYYSLSGELTYSQSGVTPLALVERDRLLIRREPRGELELLDARGVVVRRLDLGTPTRSARVEDGCMILVADGLRVVATFDLEVLHRVPWSWPRAFDRFCGGAFYWTVFNGKEVMRCDLRGQASTFAPIPFDVVEEELARFEAETGLPAMGGWFVKGTADDLATGDGLVRAMTDPDRRQWHKVGDRPPMYLWHLAPDPDGGFFLSNFIHPHILLSMDDTGRARWCRYLCSTCCGGLPAKTVSGLLVTSSGCDGILTWLDPAGHVLFRSERFPGEGLAPALSSVVRPLQDGSVIVTGGPGVVRFGRTAELLWAEPRQLLWIEPTSDPGLLAACGHAPDNREALVLELLRDPSIG